MIKKRLIRIVCLALALADIAAGACAESDAVDRFLDSWVSGDTFVDLWREEGEIKCTAAFSHGEGAYEQWEYGACWYEAEEDALWCGGVIRTSQVFDDASQQLVETDWSMDDMSFARFVFSESGATLIWTDDGMDAPVELARLAEVAAAD